VFGLELEVGEEGKNQPNCFDDSAIILGLLLIEAIKKWRKIRSVFLQSLAIVNTPFIARTRRGRRIVELVHQRSAQHL
jgi:hypothetical protein